MTTINPTEFNNIQNLKNELLNTIDQPAPVSFSMGSGVLGSWDNIRFEKKNPDYQLKSDKLFVPQGTPLPLKGQQIYQQMPTNPMFVFQRNYASPACCGNGSSFSTSTGCVCTTPAQRNEISMYRGNNKNYPDDSF